MSIRASNITLALCGAAALFCLGCDRALNADGAAGATPVAGDHVAATPGAAPPSAAQAPQQFVLQLLDLAYDTASAIPVDPHIKDRSRMQELVVSTCLALGEPERALRFAGGIEDWRQGASFADYAFYCAEHGDFTEAEAFIRKAVEVATRADEWRLATIKYKIANAYLRMGQPVKAAEFDQMLSAAEVGKTHSVRAGLIEPELFTAQVEALDNLLRIDTFDSTRNALEAFAVLFDSFYEDVEKRELAESRVKGRWNVLPHMIRIELLHSLIDAAAAHEDHSKAQDLIVDLQNVIAEVQWRAEYRVPILADLARREFRAGLAEQAKATAREALAIFEAERETIVDIHRARGLQPLAEAYAAMEERTAALQVYRMAVDEGRTNPNARPCAEDLCATLCSMAIHGVEPSEALWKRIREVREGLDHPW